MDSMILDGSLPVIFRCCVGFQKSVPFAEVEMGHTDIGSGTVYSKKLVLGCAVHCNATQRLQSTVLGY